MFYLVVVDELLHAVSFLIQAKFFFCKSLYMASQEGHVEVVHALIQAGADLNQARDNGATPLQNALIYAYQKTRDARRSMDVTL